MNWVDRIRFAQYKRKLKRDTAFRTKQKEDILRNRIWGILCGPIDNYQYKNFMYVWLEDWHIFVGLMSRLHLEYDCEDFEDKPFCLIRIKL